MESVRGPRTIQPPDDVADFSCIPVPFPSWLVYAQKDFLAVDSVGWSVYCYPRVCLSFITFRKAKPSDPLRAIFTLSIISDRESSKFDQRKPPDFSVAVLVAVGLAISGEVGRIWTS